MRADEGKCVTAMIQQMPAPWDSVGSVERTASQHVNIKYSTFELLVLDEEEDGGAMRVSGGSSFQLSQGRKHKSHEMGTCLICSSSREGGSMPGWLGEGQGWQG